MRNITAEGRDAATLLESALIDGTHGIRLTVEDGVAEVTLDRAPNNRFSYGLIAALQRLADELEIEATHRGSGLRAVVLGAAGANFSYGADFTDPELAARIMGNEATRREVNEAGRAMVDAWAELPLPVVAAARGHIIGAGACLFFTADFRFVESDAKLWLPEADRAMHLGWGVLPRLALELGLPLTRRAAMACEPIAAHELPSPSVVVSGAGEAESDARALARRLAEKPPLALRTIKQTLFSVGQVMAPAAFDDGIQFAHTTGSADFQEAMTAFIEKRKGKFQGR